MKHPKVVLVRWIDCNRFHGWQEPDTLKEHMDAMPKSESLSVGFLVHHDKHGIGLSESLCWTEQAGCTLWIPRAVIRSMVTIKKASKEQEQC